MRRLAPLPTDVRLFRKMMHDAEHHPVWSKVLVYDMSRFARNNSDAVKYTNRLNDANIELISVTQPFGNSNEGFLLQGLTHLMNEYYSRNNSKHTHAGLMTTAQKSQHCGGVPPLGYDVDANGHLVVNEYEAEAVRWIFDMYELGYSYVKMAEKLNERSYRNKYGKPFTKTSFDSILRQQKYTGTYTWNRVRQKKSEHQYNSHAYKPVEEQVIIPGGCPQIITEVQFNRVQDMLHTKDEKRALNRCHYMLSSLKIMKCAECGSYMQSKVTQSHGNEYETYFCPMHKSKKCSMKEIRCDGINELVASALADDLCSRNDLKQISGLVNYSKDYKAAKSKLKGIDKAVRNVLGALAHGCDGKMLADKLKELSADKAELTNIIAKYENETTEINEDNIGEIADRFKTFLIESDDPEVKMYLQSVVESIIVDHNDVKLTLKAS